MIPRIIEESVAVLENITDNVDKLALINTLNCKVAHLINSKNVFFKQYENSKPCVLSYYAMNFLNSGSNKDYMVDSINNYLLPFLSDELENAIVKFKERFELENQTMKQKDLEAELDKIRVANLELYNPNSQGLYREAEQINRTEFGCLCIRIGELGDYLDSCISGDKSKRELYGKLKEIYEGTIAPSIIAGDSKRKTLKNIPIVALMYSDFENLLNPKIKEYYITSLKTGMARRSFIYIPKNQKVLNYPKKPTEKEFAFRQANVLEEKFKQIYNFIEPNTIYKLSNDAKEYIYDYQCDCIDYFNNSKDNIIVKLEKKESFWKITKLACIYSIVDNPLNNVVGLDYFVMAKNFYEAISGSLATVIEKRKESEIEQFAEFISNNRHDIITNSMLRNSNIVNGNKFKHFFNEHINEIKDELLTEYNLNMYEYSDGRINSKSWQVVENEN
ncbi:MAG: hypothetical protein MJ211_10185 [Bacteroidales bacterium]|nr:hypothetical protein [Bacteroidales bacterium]